MTNDNDAHKCVREPMWLGLGGTSRRTDKPLCRLFSIFTISMLSIYYLVFKFMCRLNKSDNALIKALLASSLV